MLDEAGGMGIPLNPSIARRSDIVAFGGRRFSVIVLAEGLTLRVASSLPDTRLGKACRSHFFLTNSQGMGGEKWGWEELFVRNFHSQTHVFR